jgi:peroxiredoxin Q/BCP
MLGKPVADFSLPSTGNTTFKLSGARGSKLVLYFYPKDNTPGCTQQGSDFRDSHAAFRKTGTHIYGISRDSIKAHETFKAKMKFPFELLSDPDEAVCGAFGVMKLKNMYGRKVRGPAQPPSCENPIAKVTLGGAPQPRLEGESQRYNRRKGVDDADEDRGDGRRGAQRQER